MATIFANASRNAAKAAAEGRIARAEGNSAYAHLGGRESRRREAPRAWVNGRTTAWLIVLAAAFHGSATAFGWRAVMPINGGPAYEDGSTTVSDVQLGINQALGVSPAVNDLNHDGVVNVVDVQIAINAALGLGCPF